MPTPTSKKEQRIKLRLQDHPLKLDATLLEFDPDLRTMKIRFDHSALPDLVLHPFGAKTMSENDTRTCRTTGRIWEIL